MRGAAKSKNTPNSDRAGKKHTFFYSKAGEEEKESFAFKVNAVFFLARWGGRSKQESARRRRAASTALTFIIQAIAHDNNTTHCMHFTLDSPVCEDLHALIWMSMMSESCVWVALHRIRIRIGIGIGYSALCNCCHRGHEWNDRVL